MTDLAVETAPLGSFENPADERVWTTRILVVAARGPFGVLRAIQLTSRPTDNAARTLKDELAKHVGLMTEGVYWSQHIYEGTPWYATSKSSKDARAEHNGIWLWQWEPRYKTGDICARFDEWDHRTDYGDKRWTACTKRDPLKLADLPRGM